MPAGHFFYGQRHAVPADPELAAAVDNRRTFCIPEVEAILEEPDKRERFAVYWLGQVMDTAKEAGMRLTLSVECQESTPWRRRSPWCGRCWPSTPRLTCWS